MRGVADKLYRSAESLDKCIRKLDIHGNYRQDGDEHLKEYVQLIKAKRKEFSILYSSKYLGRKEEKACERVYESLK